MIEAIIFDCDGVLIDSETLLECVDLAFLKSLGIEMSPDEYHEQFTGSTYDQNIRVITEHHKRVHGRPPLDTIASDLSKMRTEVLEKELKAITGVVEFLEILKLPRAVASNTMTNSWLERKLSQTGLNHYFDKHIYASENVKHGKPAPDLYLFAAEKLGVSPEKCLVIEDSPRGVQAAVAARMHVIGFSGASNLNPTTHEQKLLDAGAFKVFKTMTEVQYYLESLLATPQKCFS